MAADMVIAKAGLYMAGYFIQLSARSFTDKETGEVKDKFYAMVAAGDSTRGGAVNVGLSEEEYNALVEKSLRVGAMLLIPVEAFGFQNKAYFRAIGPIAEMGA